MTTTRRQVSSGGVIFRRKGDQVEVALIARDKGKIWCLPKGLVEKDEHLEQTALREVKEETGLSGELVQKIDDIKYWYATKESGNLVRFFKIVHFFLLKYVSGSTQDHDWEVDDVRWFPIDDAIATANYKTEKEILSKAKALLSSKT